MAFLARERSYAPANFNRWLIPPAALSVHLAIGQAYATSVYKNSLIEHFEVSQTAIGVIFSIAIAMLGISAAVMGTWVEKNGPRRAMFVSACFWASGFLIGALGIFTKQLWLLYLGYGFIGGIGLGIGYISPVSTLMKWFPDRPGMATGMAIMGFGGGALVASPLSSQLLRLYDPLAAEGISPSGDAVGKLFLTLGIAYFIFMMYGVINMRLPQPGWKPKGWVPKVDTDNKMITTAHVSAKNAIKTKQFWFLWIVLCFNVTAGIGLLEQASPMIQDFFRGTDGTTSVIPAVAAGFVGVLSIANMAGRFVWSTTSDIIGRKPTYMMYLGVGALVYFILAMWGNSAMWLFVLLAFIMLSFYGGGFSTIPAYLKDLFGTYQVGAIHGRLLTAWSAAGILGPLIVNGMLDAQGEPGTMTAENYKPVLLTMVGLLVIGFIANLLVKPVDKKFHEPEEVTRGLNPTDGGH